MNILVVDNIDSFVYNLVQYMGEMGAKLYVVLNTDSMEKVERIVKDKNIAGIVISPGPGRPESAGISNDIIKKYAGNIPILGVCLGHQCIGYCFGGVVSGADKLMHGKSSVIEHTGEGVLKGIPGKFTAARYHSLVIKKVPDCLKVTAKSADDGEIMGVEHKKYMVYGLQFHPESILTDIGKRIVKNFLEIVGECKTQKT